MFRMHKDALRWAKELAPSSKTPIKTTQDVYYLFLLVGLGSNRKQSFTGSDGSDLTKDWTNDFKEYKDILVGLLLVMDFYNSGFEITTETKLIIKNRMSRVVDAGSSTHLSSKYIEIMNEYAYGGFLEVQDRVGRQIDQPQFLHWFAKELLEDVFNNP